MNKLPAHLSGTLRCLGRDDSTFHEGFAHKRHPHAFNPAPSQQPTAGGSQRKDSHTANFHHTRPCKQRQVQQRYGVGAGLLRAGFSRTRAPAKLSRRFTACESILPLCLPASQGVRSAGLHQASQAHKRRAPTQPGAMGQDLNSASIRQRHVDFHDSGAGWHAAGGSSSGVGNAELWRGGEY